MKITIGDPNARLAKPKRKLPTKRVRAETGEVTTVYTLDAHSDSLGADLLTVFRRNVARARRANAAVAKKLGIAAE